MLRVIEMLLEKTPLSIGFWTGIFVFAVKNFISYENAYKYYQSEFRFSGNSGGCYRNWGFPIEGCSMEHSFNFLIAVTCSFALGLLFHIVSEKLSPRN